MSLYHIKNITFNTHTQHTAHNYHLRDTMQENEKNLQMEMEINSKSS